MPGKSLFMCVGDVSADRHAAKLIKALKADCPDLDVWGVGGSGMEAQGARLLYNRESMAVLGLVEVIRYLPKLAAMRQDLIERLCRETPDAILLMDFGGFNIGFATQIRRRLKDVPIIYFISPQVWGSRPWRVNAIREFVTRMLVIFPFEEPLYRAKGIDARFVGNPVTLQIGTADSRPAREIFCASHGLDPARPIIGVFPGSRRQEIESHCPVILEAMNWLHEERPEIQFVVSTTNEDFSGFFYREVDRLGYNYLVGACLKTLPSRENENLMAHSELLWTKSGTTTLEAALVGKPMLIFYRGNWISFFLVLLVKIVKNVGWPNLLAGEELVPELIQLDCRADHLVRYTRDWLDVPALREEIAARLSVLRVLLGEGDFTDHAAREILAVLERKVEPESSFLPLFPQYQAESKSCPKPQ